MKNQSKENAFPMVVSAASSEAHNGLSKRELFAVMALQGLLASAEVEEPNESWFATKSIALADTLLAALEE